MIDLLKFEFSEFSFVSVIIITLLLILAFKIINRVFISKSNNRLIKKNFSYFELIVWFFFILWSINSVLKDTFYHMVAILSLFAILVGWLGWFAGRELIAGIMLRLTDNYQVGQNIRMQQLDGIINHIGFLSLSVQGDEGTIIKVPWSRISGQIYSKGIREDKSNRHTFTVNIPAAVKITELEQKVTQAVLLSAGSAIDKEPVIRQITQLENSSEYQVTVFAINPEYFQSIEQNVKNAVNSDIKNP